MDVRCAATSATRTLTLSAKAQWTTAIVAVSVVVAGVAVDLAVADPGVVALPREVADAEAPASLLWCRAPNILLFRGFVIVLEMEILLGWRGALG